MNQPEPDTVQGQFMAKVERWLQEDGWKLSPAPREGYSWRLLAAILDFLPPNIHAERGWIAVNEIGQTTDVKVFAIGDATRLGLVTHSIGQGRITADTIHYQLMHAPRLPETKQVIPYERIKAEYYDVCRGDFTPEHEANKCMSCATCR